MAKVVWRCACWHSTVLWVSVAGATNTVYATENIETSKKLPRDLSAGKNGKVPCAIFNRHRVPARQPWASGRGF